MFHDGWLYHSTDKDVYRYKYIPGELVPSAAPEHLIVDLPNQRQHESKAFLLRRRRRALRRDRLALQLLWRGQ